MQFLTEEDIKIIGALPLTEVMRHNGHHISHKTSACAFYNCPLSTHDDKDASFSVELSPSESSSTGETTFAAFNCMGCHQIHGRGAIELQAALLGCTVQGADFIKVVTRLVRDFHLNIKGVKPAGTDYSFVDPVSEFQYEECDWTDEHLRALGCSVQQKYRTGSTDGDEQATGENIYGWSFVGEIGEEEQVPMPFDPSELGRIFGLYPISSFVTPAVDTGGGVMRSYRQTTNEQYPIFIFRSTDANGKWRIKKYEPYNRPDGNGRQYKWTWWYEGGHNLDSSFRSAVYGDCDVMDALYNTDVVPQDTSTYHNHPVVTKRYKDKDGVTHEKKLFKRIVICSGPRDAMQVYYHSDAHVVYPHSETANISLRAIHRLLSIAENIYILFDMDETGQREARKLNLEYLKMCNVTLPADLATLTGRRNGKPCKDVSDFFEQYWQIARHKQSMRHLTINEIFSNILGAAHPLKFWKTHVKKNAVEYDDGSVQDSVYELHVDNMIRFLAVSGLGVYRGRNAEEPSRFVYIEDNMVEFLRDEEVVGKAKQLMKDWLTSHRSYNDTELRSTIIRSTQIICRSTLFDELPVVDINPMYWGPTWDYLFFSNGALKVTPTEIRLIPYGELGFLVNKEQILPRAYVETPRLFSIVPNPMFEQYERKHQERLDEIPSENIRAISDENARWRKESILWPYRLELKKPMNEMPVAFQFLYDTGRVYWKKEHLAKRDGKQHTHWLSPEQHQFQDMQFINKAAGIGYVLSRYRQSNFGKMAYVVDYSVDDERKSQGGTGKSIIPKMLNSVRKECRIDGKGWKTGEDMGGRNFVSYDYLKHGYIHIEDLKRGVGPEDLYNIANSDFNRKRLNKDEETIRAEYAAKVFITSNTMFDESAESTARRLWTMRVSNYYHNGNNHDLEHFDPHQKFGFDLFEGKEISDMPQEEYDAMVTMFVQCLQFFLQERRYIEAPMEGTGMLRQLYANPVFKGNQQFIPWAGKLFSGDLFLGIPLPKTDLIISYFQYSGKDVTKDSIMAYAQGTKFGEMLKVYCDSMGITYNPDIIYKRPSEIGRLPRTGAYVYDFLSTGRLAGTRSLNQRASCYFFYRRGEEPVSQDDVMYSQCTDPACEGYIIED